MSDEHNPPSDRRGPGPRLVQLPPVEGQTKEVDLLLAALVTIAVEGLDSESVRIALVTLYETKLGRDYMERNDRAVKF